MYQNNSMTILVAGKYFTFALTKTTTSDDVIKMAKKSSIIPNDDKQYGLFEKHTGAEKLLSGNTRLQKLVRTMGVNTPNFQLELKLADKINSKMASISSAKSKLKKIRQILKKNEMKDHERYEEVNLDRNVCRHNDKVFDKNFPFLNYPTVPVSKVKDNMISGKVEMMTRYLQNCESEYLCHQVSRLSDIERSRGDGCEDDDSYLIDEGNITEYRHFGRDLDTAFIFNTSFVENTTTTKCDELNDCVLYDDLDNTVADDESAFDDESECASVCELERNIIEVDSDDSVMKIDKLKAAFNECCLNTKHSDDSILDSFMNTFTQHDDSDEGLSSAGSDFE
ncbi:hypothetical protein ACF0H5_012136 [Mactra antiquata]